MQSFPATIYVIYVTNHVIHIVSRCFSPVTPIDASTQTRLEAIYNVISLSARYLQIQYRRPSHAENLIAVDSSKHLMAGTLINETTTLRENNVIFARTAVLNGYTG
jgi:hypothetical protein